MGTGDVVVEGFFSLFQGEITVAELARCSEISTPFLDRHNDHIPIYVFHDGDWVTLSDGGETVADLESSGLRLIRSRLEKIVRGFGVKYNPLDETLSIATTQTTYGRDMLNLIQTILALEGAFYCDN